MFTNIKGEPKAMTSRKVSEPEFIRLCLENGMTEEKARIHTRICKELDKKMILGEEMISINAD
jgi:hypothetical protein